MAQQVELTAIKLGKTHSGDLKRLQELVGNQALVTEYKDEKGRDQFYILDIDGEENNLRKEIGKQNPASGTIKDLWHRFREGDEYTRGTMYVTNSKIQNYGMIPHEETKAGNLYRMQDFSRDNLRRAA